MSHKIPRKPGILELAKLVGTKLLALLAGDTEGESVHVSLSTLHSRSTGCRGDAEARAGTVTAQQLPQSLGTWNRETLAVWYRAERHQAWGRAMAEFGVPILNLKKLFIREMKGEEQMTGNHR